MLSSCNYFHKIMLFTVRKIIYVSKFNLILSILFEMVNGKI